MINKNLENVLAWRYVENNIKNIVISIAKLSKIPAIYMIKSNQLEGWCWQSATFLSVNFKNSDVVARGNLVVSKTDNSYFHSWIEFKLMNKYYVFDPCFGIICDKDEYYQEYNVTEVSKIKVKEIKKELINLKGADKKINIHVDGTNDVEDVFFRTNSKVNANIRFNKIKKLEVRYYYNG